MSKTTKLKNLHDLVKFQKKQAYQILAHSYPDDKIRALCQKFSSRPPSQSKDILDDITFAATAALVLFTSLEKKIPSIGKEWVITSEDMAHIAIDCINAGQCLAEAGWLPAKRPAETRLKMLKNQPKTRKRNNSEKFDIQLMLEDYKKSKGYLPKDYNIFLKYLKSEGYEEDRSDNSIYHHTWNKQKSISTVRRWFDEIRKTLS